MRAGRIEQVATPAVLYETPSTEFSAAFIGNRNTLDLPVRDGRIRLCGTTVLDTDVTTPRALVFVRPEDVRLAESGQAARIENRIFQGSTTRFYLALETEDGPLHLKADWPSRDTAGLGLGDRVHIAVDARDAHVFPA